MKYRNNKKGRISTGARSENRFISSDIVNDTQKSSIIIIALVLSLAIITAVFFAVFAEDDFAAFNPHNNTGPIFSPNDPDSKPVFVATEGGKGMYQMDLSSKYAILVRLSDMTTIAHKYADERIYPASMTKVMTVITALDLIENLDDTYILTEEVLKTVPSDASVASLLVYYQKGQTEVSIRDLLYGISYRSGADSVLCLLDYLGLSVEDFATLMNNKAQEIGLKDSYFGGAIGMDTEENQTTCRDVAAIMAYAMENKVAFDLFSGGRHQLDMVEGYSYYHATIDNLLANMGTNGSTVLGLDYTLLAAKSGLEDKAGYCLVSYIRNDVTNEYFVLVTAGADRAEDYPVNREPILDMELIFDAFEP